MENSELIKMGAAAVKNNAAAYALYKSRFAEAFGREPLCPTGCGSSKGQVDWQSFTRLVNGESPEVIKSNYLNFENMENKTFIVKDKLKIFRYTDDSGKIRRSYGDTMTEEFAVAYIEASADENEKAQKLRIFSQIPAKFRTKTDEEKEAEKLLKSEGKKSKKDKDENTVKSLKDFKLKELKLVASKFEGADLEEFNSFKSIADLATFLESKDVKVQDIDDAIVEDMS